MPPTNTEKLGQLVESRYQAIVAERDKLVETWSRYINSADAYFQKKEGRKLSVVEKHNMAQCLDNALMEVAIRRRGNVFETTYSDNITFLGVQLPVIAALLPSLVMNKIGVVQALDRRTGSVFYLDVQYGQNKGSLTADSTLIGAKTGHASSEASRKYATNRVYDEAATLVSGTTYGGTTTYKPVIAGSMTVTDGVETFTDDGSGNLVTDDSAGADGTIVYATGVYSVTFTNAVAAAPTMDYRYNMEKDASGVPEVNVNLDSSTIEAEDFKLRAKYQAGAAIDLQKAHGLNLESELVKFLGGEIKFEIDHFGIDLIYNAAIGAGAATPIGAWSAALGTGQEWVFKRYQFLDYIEKGSNAIFAKTLRGQATYILAGNNAARVIKQLDPHFKPVANLGKMVPTGPMEIGTLDGRLVIQDPFLPTNTYVLGFKGDSYLFAGFIYAPYIPLFTTPTILLSNLEAQKGFFSAQGFKVINEGLFTYGTVSNLP